MSPPVADSTKEDTKATQRRINKPLIEKRRRARINDCLVQLKTIVLEAQESQSPRPSKLEKADILEMTVEFIKKRTGPTANASENCYHDDENQQTDYMAGYTGCLAEVSKFLTKTNGIGQELKEKIIKHMTEKVRDSNNNVSPEGENLSKPANKIPISRDPSKSLTESTDFRPAKKSDAEAKPESKSGDKDTFLPGNTTPMAQEFSNNFQNSATGLFPGSQVLLVLQLPPAQNMMASNPITGQFSNMANISNSAIPVLQAESTHEAIDLSQPQSNVIKNVLNPHHPTRQTVDDPAAILGSSFKNCDIYTQNMRSVQNLPLNLCTNNRKNELPSDDDPWRPW